MHLLRVIVLAALLLPGIRAHAATLDANPTANNGGSPTWAIFFDLTAAEDLTVTGFTTASTAPADGTFQVEVFRREGTALGGSIASGPGSDPAGWTSVGTYSVTQGAVASGISLPIDISTPGIAIDAGQTVGIAVRFESGPRYFGTGSAPLQTFSDASLTLLAGDARTVPFTTTGAFFSSRALTGSIIYETGAGVSADLAVTLADDLDPTQAGGNLDYTATASNVGPAAAEGVTITLQPPAGIPTGSPSPSPGGSCSTDTSCSWAGATAPGVVRTVNFRVEVPSTAAAGSLLASATVSSSTPDPVDGNDTDTETTEVDVVADLVLDKRDGRSMAHVGETLIYTISVENAGLAFVPGAVLSDTVPAGLDAAAWACNPITSTAACPAPPNDAGTGDLASTFDLPPFLVLRFDLMATVAGKVDSTITNTATVTVPATVLDPLLADNTASDTTLIVPVDIFGDGFEGPADTLRLPSAADARQGARSH